MTTTFRACLRWLISMSLIVWVDGGFAWGQNESIRPGINESFQNPDVQQFVDRFEREGRDPYDHRTDVLKALKLRRGMDVADVGAGTGLFTRLMAPEVAPTGKVYAVDISEKFVRHVEETSAEAGLKNVEGVVCPPDSVALPADSVDLVFICDTYHHFEYPMRTLASVHRALRAGGQLVLIDFRRVEGVSTDWVLEHVRAGQEVFVKEIQEAGFEQVEELPDLLDESYFVRFRKVERAEVGEGER